MKWFDRLRGMQGRLGLTREEEAECLAYYAATPGDYVEIGCLWGGSALIAALAKEDDGTTGDVFTIDHMSGGWWDGFDPEVKKPPTPAAVLSNLADFWVAYRVHIIRDESDPWPLPDSVQPSVVFIDGDHSYEGCLRDWNNVRNRACHYVLFHDYAASHPGVQRVIDEQVKPDKHWRFVQVANSIAVFERVDDGAILSRLCVSQPVERV